MLGTTDLGIFVVAGLILNITPGVDLLYIAGRSASQGVKAGVVAALGIGAGCFIHILFAAFGLSVVLATSALAFAVVKWAGAAYLVYLGVTSLISLRVGADFGKAPVRPLAMMQIFRQAILINVLNPKVALFFMALLPQFVAPNAAHPALTLLFLGGIFDLNGTLVNILFAIFSARIAASLQGNSLLGRIGKTAVGCLFIGLGLRLALLARE